MFRRANVECYAGDDTGACARFDKLIDRLMFAPVQVGGLREEGKLMQLGGPLSALHVLKQDSPVASDGQGRGL